MTRLPLIVQSERCKRIGFALIGWLQMFIVFRRIEFVKEHAC
ncbi:hypothetical protein Gotur_019614 [Gossypium turneri]